MNGRYKRPDIKQITRQWVKENCHNVTDRDIGLLKLLSNRRLLRRDQIEKLYPEFPSSDYLNKRLNILFKGHLIDKVYPKVGLGKGSSKQHICLDRAGISLLGLEKYNKPIRVDLEGNRSLPLGWEHVVKINDYECHMRSLEGAKIRDYLVEEPLNYGDTKIIPDIFCLMEYNKKGYLFFIEVDLGTEDVPYIKKKIDAYIDYYSSRQWLHQPWAKVFKTPTFPRVLFLTEDGRSKRVNSIREYSEGKSVRFFVEEHNNFGSLIEQITKG